MDLNDVIFDLGGVERISAPLAVSATDAQITTHLATNCVGSAIPTLAQVKSHIAIFSNKKTSGLKSSLLLKIDADIDAVYAKVVGNRFAEYQDAASEAKAFKDLLYVGAAGASVAAWATVKANTPAWAADDILATAAAWKGAQAQMRQVRLQHKENVRLATTPEQLAAVETSWLATLAAIKTSLGIN